uniref:Galactose mutarotase n=1 Tax=Ciona savignyi TaxID=51511 RepID=H2ZB51_CIOSA
MSEHTVTLNNEESSCKVHLFGATVTSWVSGGQERLFLSSEAKMDGTKAIRGGIPIVFPNFGPWECGPQHGFARISWWTVSLPPTKLDNGDMQVVLELCDDEITRNMWDYSFKLQYSITLSGSTLSCELNVTNTSTKPFDFTTLLHTYIRVDDIKQTTISGFQNCAFVDKVESNEGIEVNNEVKITKNVDRVYAGTVGHTV